jgi:hypothetical protein
MAVTSGHRERADEPLKEALLAARNGSGSDGDGEKDLEEIRSVGSFLRHAAEENRKLWYLAGPAIITSITQYSLGGITQVFAGHLTTLELDAISTENNVIAGLAFGIMVCVHYTYRTFSMPEWCGVHRSNMRLARTSVCQTQAVKNTPVAVVDSPRACHTYASHTSTK